jgi:putative transposase
MQKPGPLTFGNYFHIYNHGVGKRNLFCEPDNYEYFLDLYDQHISPLAETYAWVLMPTHFHLLVRIKEVAKLNASLHLTDFENLSCVKPPHQFFSNLFNAYTKALNIRLGSHGALFERPFKRKLIDSDDYLKQVILYIHNNPVHHGFCSHPIEYPWSSYLTCISIKPTKLKRDAVMGWFDNEANFKVMHDGKVEIEAIEKWLGL